MEDLPRPGQPSTSSTEVNIAKVQEMVTENRYLGLREIAPKLSVSHESILTILIDCLGLKSVAARLIPKDLNFLLKLNCVRAKNSTNIIEQPRYLSNMAPIDFFLFPKFKLSLRGNPFQSIPAKKKLILLDLVRSNFQI